MDTTSYLNDEHPNDDESMNDQQQEDDYDSELDPNEEFKGDQPPMMKVRKYTSKRDPSYTKRDS